MSKRLTILMVVIVVVIGIFVVSQLLPQIPPGAGPTASPASNLDRDAVLQAFAQCMRDNGVPAFPDPLDGGIMLDESEIDPNAPAFKAAESACEALLPPPPDGSAAAGNSPWAKVVPGGECQCADGSEFAFWVRQADPSRVLFYLGGGGVCFDATSCANKNTPATGERPGADYDPNIGGEDPARQGGMFDLAHAENPFRDYSVIYVPLCTADSHLGAVTREYTPALTVEHKGFINGTAALSYLAQHYPDAAQVAVVGKTAGSVAAPIYGGLVADRLPDAQVIVFGAQSGAFPGDPDVNAGRLGQWGTFETMPDWQVNAGLTARDWGAPRFWIQAGLHDRDLIMARFDYAFDPHAMEALEYFAVSGVDPSNPLAVIDANEAVIEAAGVVLHSYTAPGQGHGILEFPVFYELEVNGVRLVDWIKALLAGVPLDDVHCGECRTE